MTEIVYPDLNVVVLAGGVGGAKMVNGLAQLVKPENLLIVANTGDDFEHLGLWITPDLDTVMYKLAGINNTETGWGRADESWEVMAHIGAMGGPTWFNLGDKDLANNLIRTHWRRQGYPLSWITEQLCQMYKVPQKLTPMTDDVVQTVVHSDAGELSFQEYFVHRRCEPRVSYLEFQGVTEAEPNRNVLNTIRMADLIVFAPSNPFLSLDPILSLPGVARVIAAASAPTIAVSPIIGGAAVKGPAGKLMQEFGMEVSPVGVAAHLQHVINGIVIDSVDQDHLPRIAALGLHGGATETMMTSPETEANLARSVIEFGLSIGRERGVEA